MNRFFFDKKKNTLISYIRKSHIFLDFVREICPYSVCFFFVPSYLLPLPLPRKYRNTVMPKIISYMSNSQEYIIIHILVWKVIRFHTHLKKNKNNHLTIISKNMAYNLWFLYLLRFVGNLFEHQPNLNESLISFL